LRPGRHSYDFNVNIHTDVRKQKYIVDIFASTFYYFTAFIVITSLYNTILHKLNWVSKFQSSTGSDASLIREVQIATTAEKKIWFDFNDQTIMILNKVYPP